MLRIPLRVVCSQAAVNQNVLGRSCTRGRTCAQPHTHNCMHVCCFECTCMRRRTCPTSCLSTGRQSSAAAPLPMHHASPAGTPSLARTTSRTPPTSRGERSGAFHGYGTLMTLPLLCLGWLYCATAAVYTCKRCTERCCTAHKRSCTYHCFFIPCTAASGSPTSSRTQPTLCRCELGPGPVHSIVCGFLVSNPQTFVHLCECVCVFTSS